MIHIVFQHQNAAALEKAFELDPSLGGDIMLIKDDFSVGPVKDIFEEEGIAVRNAWWKDIWYGHPVEFPILEDGRSVERIKQKLKADPEEQVWLWVASNKQDISGYYWLISLLKAFQGRVSILFLSNLPFISEKGHVFYPVSLFEIPPREFIKAKKLLRPVSGAAFETDPDEWTRICKEDKMVRVLEGGKKLTQHDPDYYDSGLKKFIGAEWQKTARILHQYISKSAFTTGDAYLLWRVKQMIASGEIAEQGDQIRLTSLVTG